MAYNNVLNGVYIVKKLMSDLGLTDYQAAGFAGCFMAESGCNPGSYNKAEKSGTFSGSSANGSGYGAGLAQWSNSWKTSIQKQFNRYTPIESWTLNQQIEIVTKGCASSFIAMIKRCSSVSQSTDIVLRGYENGSAGKGTTLRSTTSMKGYTWCKRSYIADVGYQTFSDGYIGALTARTAWANKILKAMGSTNLADLSGLGDIAGSVDYGLGGVTGGTSNSYPVHSEYTTFTGAGGNIYENAGTNAFTQASFSDAKIDQNNNTQHTRIYSTNDACIVLDELAIPYDEDVTYANKGVTTKDVEKQVKSVEASAKIEE